jgi:hypothetical protein
MLWLEGWLLPRSTRLRASTIRAPRSPLFSTATAPPQWARSFSIPGGTSPTTAFTFAGGVYQILTVPSSNVSIATGINGAGLIVGVYEDLASVRHGFAKSGGTFSNVDFPGATETQAIGVNDAGQIVGDYFDAASVEHGAVWKAPAFGQLPAGTKLARTLASTTSPRGNRSSGAVILSAPPKRPSRDPSLNLHFGDALHLCAGGIDDLLRPPQQSPLRTARPRLLLTNGNDPPRGSLVDKDIQRSAEGITATILV